MNEILEKLRFPFHPSVIEWKPQSVAKDGSKAMAIAYADPRAYMERLDEVCGIEWGVTYTPWGDKILCHLTVGGWTRSSSGEPDAQSERSEIAGTAAEAQAFKRAGSMFGLGRYLYNLPSVWVEIDQYKKFTAASQVKLDRIVNDHYKRVMGEAESKPNVSRETIQRVVVDRDDLGDAVDEALAGAGMPMDDNPFNGPKRLPMPAAAAPVVAISPATLTSEKLMQFAAGCAKKHAYSEGQCTEKQYPLLVRIIDEIAGRDSHGAVLAYLCDSPGGINKDNRPGYELTSFLIKHLSKTAKAADGQYGPNPNYKPEYVQALIQVYEQAREAV